MSVLPKSNGKSLPFQLLPFIQKEMDRTVFILECCPLLSLMRDEMERTKEIKSVNEAYKGSQKMLNLIGSNVFNGTPFCYSTVF